MLGERGHEARKGRRASPQDEVQEARDLPEGACELGIKMPWWFWLCVQPSSLGGAPTTNDSIIWLVGYFWVTVPNLWTHGVQWKKHWIKSQGT